MEPVTHMLTGAVLARAGVNRKAAYAVWAMVIAAEFPDVDVVWGLGGPLTGFMHHRGMTHTFLALPLEAALITGAFWAWDRWRVGRSHASEARQGAPTSWWWLFGGCWLALLSHLLLDWTNNYGLRPFFPFNPRWYAGSFVFIFEPVMFVLLVGALVMPALFGLVGSEVGARRVRFRGRGWAVAALVGVAGLYGWRYAERGRAIELAAANAPAGTTRVFASPYPIDPFRWATVSDSPEAYQLQTVDTRRGIVLPTEPADTIARPSATLEILRAKRTELGRVYLDWSMFPAISAGPMTDDPRHPLTEVRFADARFMYSVWGLSDRSKPRLSGTVVLDMAEPEQDRVVQQWMDGKLQK